MEVIITKDGTRLARKYVIAKPDGYYRCVRHMSGRIDETKISNFYLELIRIYRPVGQPGMFTGLSALVLREGRALTEVVLPMDAFVNLSNFRRALFMQDYQWRMEWGIWFRGKANELQDVKLMLTAPDYYADRIAPRAARDFSTQTLSKED